MKITRLRVHGFKSFVDAADIVIQPGLTGVVGPNGCGKSNLVEALRFVMGESSYKAMRGGGMDDVIFAGAADRPARNLAEVTLIAERGDDNGAETLEITRRIERDAGSAYKLNGREARARDVQLLFADAATGAHSSALVRQGQIAELIAAKPVQRRGILEDAAGISGLHSRRGEAESRLKAAEVNLERLDDVMGEIAGRLEGLQRQARQAVRYRKLSSEIRRSEAILAMLDWQTVTARCGEAEAAFTAATIAYAAAIAEQAEAARIEATAATRLPQLRDHAAASASALQRARFAAGELDREEAGLKARRDKLTVLRDQAAADLRHQADIDQDAEAAAARIGAEAARLEAERREAGQGIATARDFSLRASTSLTAAEADFAAAAGALAAANAERSGRERALREAQAKTRRLDDERRSVVSQRDKLSGESGSDDVVEAAAGLWKAECQLTELEAEAQAGEEVVAAAHETERRAREPLGAAERHLGVLQAEARTLADLLDLDRTTRFKPLLETLEVAPGFEVALVAALGDDLDASLDPAAPSAWLPCGSGGDDPPMPEGASPLADAVKGPPQITRRLKQVGVVTAEAAFGLAATLAPGQRLVTREGALWRWDGLTVEAGSATAGARRLEQRKRVGRLVQELKTARQTVEEAARRHETAKQVRADAERLDTMNRQALRDARQTVDRARSATMEAERRAGRVNERLSAYSGALARLEADADAARADINTAEEALAALEEASALAKHHDALRARLAAERERAADLRLAAAKALDAEAVRSRRAAELAQERERWAARVARAAERAGELADRLASTDAELRALAIDPASFTQRRRSLLDAIGAAEEKAAMAADALASAEAEHRGVAHAGRAALDRLGQAREKRARDEERALAVTGRRDDLALRIAEQFGRPIDDLRRLSGLDDDAVLPASASVETRLGKLRLERERLGAVNLRAEDEAREIEARLASMRSERDDLDAAIRRLRDGIVSLNREGRGRLLAAFEAVNGHFRSLFQILFGGGTAELTLTGSGDPLEAGLEIVARPPGKRPHTMTLLSGGEQALTALSLIFAVFLTNPSPICVLDEVDAPLDDANVERFCALLDDMRRRTDTRFLVVTHNPITMARMDRLYGVTMAERGVSQVVSVELGAAERFREAS